MPLRLIFMGTPDFSVPTLRALDEHGHRIVAVYTRPTKLADRGLRPRVTPVEREALRIGVPVYAPFTLRTSDAVQEFNAHHADAAIVVAYGMILPPQILDAPRYGCFNLHASLLPNWRGAAPIHRSIMAGDAETGVMVMKMDAGLDTGDIALSESVQITDATTTGELSVTLARIGADLMVRAMYELEHHRLNLRSQGNATAGYATKITNAEARIDWTMPAHKVLRHIHGLSPLPGAWCEIPFGEAQEPVRVKVLRCELAFGEGPPGFMLDNRLTIACGNGAIRLLELQRAGKGPMSASAFLAGARLRPPVRLS
jgi:methionyl-tRNA formyltransferase